MQEESDDILAGPISKEEVIKAMKSLNMANQPAQME